MPDSAPIPGDLFHAAQPAAGDRGALVGGSLDPCSPPVVEPRRCGGLSIDDIARVLGMAPRTVDLPWATARAWLHHD